MSGLSYEQRLAANGEEAKRLHFSLPVVVIEVRDRHREQSRQYLEHLRLTDHGNFMCKCRDDFVSQPKALWDHGSAFKEKNPGQNLPPARYQYVDVPGDE